ncbi:hypothetical protein BDZ45DRAFT_409504 [Acephala macrosclerotiorum]|nr:hypothetical protein BDZ45DRAFT_409504 [Acephala macrosclerotiorum]
MPPHYLQQIILSHGQYTAVLSEYLSLLWRLIQDSNVLSGSLDLLRPAFLPHMDDNLVGWYPLDDLSPDSRSLDAYPLGLVDGFSLGATSLDGFSPNGSPGDVSYLAGLSPSGISKNCPLQLDGYPMDGLSPAGDSLDIPFIGGLSPAGDSLDIPFIDGCSPTRPDLTGHDPCTSSTTRYTMLAKALWLMHYPRTSFAWSNESGVSNVYVPGAGSGLMDGYAGLRLLDLRHLIL